jgi:hypothetical protein
VCLDENGIKESDPSGMIRARVDNIEIEKRSILIQLHNTWQPLEEIQNAQLSAPNNHNECKYPSEICFKKYIPHKEVGIIF